MAAHQSSVHVPLIRFVTGTPGMTGTWRWGWGGENLAGHNCSLNKDRVLTTTKREWLQGQQLAVCTTLIKLHWNVLSLSPLPSELMTLDRQRHPIILVFLAHGTLPGTKYLINTTHPHPYAAEYLKSRPTYRSRNFFSHLTPAVAFLIFPKKRVPFSYRHSFRWGFL